MRGFHNINSDIDSEMCNRVKAYTVKKGKKMCDRLIESIIAKLEDEIDALEGLAALADTEDTRSLDDYLSM
jgi:hypothetical protein